MDLYSGKKVGVSREEQKQPYYKFFERKMAEIPLEKLKALDNPADKEIVSFADKNLFLKGEDGDYCQIGYGITSEGAGFVCNETYMSGVTTEMLDWWFPWHSVGSDLRYKIWDPEDHYFARADRADYVCDPKVPIAQKTWGVNHYILEDVGMGADFVKLCFKSPADFGYDTSIIGTEKCASMVCAVGEGNCAAAMTHKWYSYKDGVMFVSRFWLGYGMVDGDIMCILPESVKVPVEAAKGLYAHNIKEFSNLAAILPEVYAEKVSDGF